MSAKPSPLRLVDPDTGVIGEDAPSYPEALTALDEAALTIRGLEHDLRGKRLQIANLKADRERDAFDLPERRETEALHKLHAAATKANPKTPTRNGTLTFDIREKAAHCLRELGFRECVAAVLGIAYDPGWSQPGRNGKRECYNRLELSVRNTSNAERYAAKVPEGWTPPVERIAETTGEDIEWVRERLEAPPRAAAKSKRGARHARRATE